MSIFKLDTIITTYPAYDIVSRQVDSKGFVNISAGDTLYAYKSKTFKVGSVVSSALENNQDPIEAYKRTVSRGHETHYIYGLGAYLTSHKQEKKTHLQVDFDAVYMFEGHKFNIIKTANDNLAFKRVS